MSLSNKKKVRKYSIGNRQTGIPFQGSNLMNEAYVLKHGMGFLNLQHRETINTNPSSTYFDWVVKENEKL